MSMIPIEESERIADKVIESLLGRGGFDHWWFNLDDDIQQEIAEEMGDRINSELNFVFYTVPTGGVIMNLKDEKWPSDGGDTNMLGVVAFNSVGGDVDTITSPMVSRVILFSSRNPQYAKLPFFETLRLAEKEEADNV